MLQRRSHGTGSFDDKYPGRADRLSEVLVTFLSDASITDREPDDRLVAVSVAIVHVDVTVDNGEHLYAVVYVPDVRLVRPVQAHGRRPAQLREVVCGPRTIAGELRSTYEAHTVPFSRPGNAVGYHGQPTVNRRYSVA